MKKTLWVDTETTGADYKNDVIIELACIFEADDGQTQTFHRYILPALKPANYDDMVEIHGIEWGHLQGVGIPEEECFKEFIQFLDSCVNKFDKKDKMVFAGYRSIFDNEFVREMFTRNHHDFFGSYFYSACLDVMSTAVELFRKGEHLQNLENFKLGTVCANTGFVFEAHNALKDIWATRKLYTILKYLETKN